MSDFQVSILPSRDQAKIAPDSHKSFDVSQHSRTSDKVLSRIEDLEEVWEQVVKRLSGLAAKSDTAGQSTEFELKSIEFNLGVEAGLEVGLVTKASASVSIVFSKK